MIFPKLLSSVRDIAEMRSAEPYDARQCSHA
jgi:hypothetical protein